MSELPDVVAAAVTSSYLDRCHNARRHKGRLNKAIATNDAAVAHLHRVWSAELKRCAELVEFMVTHGIPVPKTKKETA